MSCKEIRGQNRGLPILYLRIPEGVILCPCISFLLPSTVYLGAHFLATSGKPIDVNREVRNRVRLGISNTVVCIQLTRGWGNDWSCLDLTASKNNNSKNNHNSNNYRLQRRAYCSYWWPSRLSENNIFVSCIETILQKQTRCLRLKKVTIWQTLADSPTKISHTTNPLANIIECSPCYAVLYDDLAVVQSGAKTSFRWRTHSCFSQNSCRRETETDEARVAQNRAKGKKHGNSRRVRPYVHLLKYKALAGPNIHPSYNPSVNRLRSFRLSWVGSTQPAERGGSAVCEWSCVEAACIMSSIHKKRGGEVMASDYPAGCCLLYKFLFCVCDRQLFTLPTSFR